jgi:hypothetical protein
VRRLAAVSCGGSLRIPLVEVDRPMLRPWCPRWGGALPRGFCSSCSSIPLVHRKNRSYIMINRRPHECIFMDREHLDVLLTATIAHDGLMRFGRFFRCLKSWMPIHSVSQGQVARLKVTKSIEACEAVGTTVRNRVPDKRPKCAKVQTQ